MKKSQPCPRPSTSLRPAGAGLEGPRWRPLAAADLTSIRGGIGIVSEVAPAAQAAPGGVASSNG